MKIYFISLYKSAKKYCRLIFISIFFLSAIPACCEPAEKYIKLPLLNKHFMSLGMPDTKPYNIKLLYSYTNNDKFIMENAAGRNFSNYISPVNIPIDVKSMKKTGNAAGVELGINIIPVLKLYASYYHSENDINIRSSIKQIYMVMRQDYEYTKSIKESSDSFMAGTELGFAYKINDFAPFIAVNAGFGATASSLDGDLSYFLNVSAKIGSKIYLPKNMVLDVWTGAACFIAFNPNGYRIAYTQHIPKEYLNSQTGISSSYPVKVSMEYAYDYSKCADMLLGFTLYPHKNIGITFETAFINRINITAELQFIF